MSRQEFFRELRERLTGLMPEDIEDRLSYYNEIIEQRMAGGMAEESAVASLGTVDQIVERIMSEFSLADLVRDKVHPKKKHKTWVILLLVLGFPAWFPISVAMLTLIFTLYLLIWLIVLCLYVVDFSFAAVVLTGCFITMNYWKAGELAGAFVLTGLSLIAAGITILWFLGCLGITKGVAKLTGKFFLKLKTSFVGKDHKKGGL